MWKERWERGEGREMGEEGERWEKEKGGGKGMKVGERRDREVEREKCTLTHQPKKWLGTNTSILSIMTAKEPFGWPGV